MVSLHIPVLPDVHPCEATGLAQIVDAGETSLFDWTVSVQCPDGVNREYTGTADGYLDALVSIQSHVSVLASGARIVAVVRRFYPDGTIGSIAVAHVTDTAA